MGNKTEHSTARQARDIYTITRGYVSRWNSFLQPGHSSDYAGSRRKRLSTHLCFHPNQGTICPIYYKLRPCFSWGLGPCNLDTSDFPRSSVWFKILYLVFYDSPVKEDKPGCHFPNLSAEHYLDLQDMHYEKRNVCKHVS